MSSVPAFSKNGRFSGRRTVNMPEKSNFSQTCSLLSQYLKENGSFGDLNLGMTCNVEGKGKAETSHQAATTVNLLPTTEISGEVLGVSNQNTPTASYQKVKFMELFPQNAGFGPSISVEDVPKKTDCRPAETEPETAQMTIFYAGKVFVFHELAADKAKEVMLFASTSKTTPNSGNFTSVSGTEQLNSGSFAASAPKFMPISGKNPTQEHLQRPPQPSVSDLPIARKASLHRFLEKRKDRIIAKAPYQVQVNISAAATPSKSEETITWLGLASKSS